jgi:hypothetical protein
MDKLGIWNDRSYGRVLLQDLFCRRIPIPTGMTKELNRFDYAEDVVKAHVQFADDVWEQWDAPVGLLIGATVVEQYMRSGLRTDTVHVALEPRRMAFRPVGKFQLEFGVFVEYRSGEHGREIRRLVSYTRAVRANTTEPSARGPAQHKCRSTAFSCHGSHGGRVCSTRAWPRTLTEHGGQL